MRKDLEEQASHSTAPQLQPAAQPVGRPRAWSGSRPPLNHPSQPFAAFTAWNSQMVYYSEDLFSQKVRKTSAGHEGPFFGQATSSKVESTDHEQKKELALKATGLKSKSEGEKPKLICLTMSGFIFHFSCFRLFRLLRVIDGQKYIWI